MYDELRQIRELIDNAFVQLPQGAINARDGLEKAFTLINRLEASENDWQGTEIIISRIYNSLQLAKSAEEFKRAFDEGGALIGQYAYRYSEEIRKDRDYRKRLTMDFHDAVNAEAEKRKKAGNV